MEPAVKYFRRPSLLSSSAKGTMWIVDDPRVAIVSARPAGVGRVSREPVAPLSPRPKPSWRQGDERDLLDALGQADEWNRVAITKEDQAASGVRIRARAKRPRQLSWPARRQRPAHSRVEDRALATAAA